VRGTRLKGLGGIAPLNGNVIRPMLPVTREDVLEFLQEYHVAYVEDSSNETDVFLRNRIRHHVMPLLRQENPCLGENVSAMALRLRQDEQLLAQGPEYRVEVLQKMHPAQRSRALAACLEGWGVKEPEGSHVALAESLVFSGKPSAKASFPGGVTVCRNYDRLELCPQEEKLESILLNCPGETVIPSLGMKIVCTPAQQVTCQPDCFTVDVHGAPFLRCRQTGDEMRLPGGRKSLKKLFIDRKIPATQRSRIPVIADDRGILGVYGIGPDRDRVGAGVQIRFEPI